METVTQDYTPLNLMGLTEEEEFENLTEDEDEDEDDDIVEEFIDNGKGQKIRKPEKIEIQITDKNDDGTLKRFGEGVDDVGGQPYTSVSYMAKRYGGSGGHIGESDIQHAIEMAKKCIEREGDTPVVKDMRVKESLSEWFGG